MAREQTMQSLSLVNYTSEVPEPLTKELISETPISWGRAVSRDVLEGQRAQSGFDKRLQRWQTAVGKAVERQRLAGTNQLEGRGGRLARLPVAPKRMGGGGLTSPPARARLAVSVCDVTAAHLKPLDGRHPLTTLPAALYIPEVVSQSAAAAPCIQMLWSNPLLRCK